MTNSASDVGGLPSLATDERHAEEASATAQDEAEALATSDGGYDAGKRNPEVDVLAKGIASVLGPVMNDFDGGVEGALKSQSVLASSIDRLTRELDKLLEDVPHPYTSHHATRLSGIRKRVISLNTTLRIIQKRMDMIQRLRDGYASRAASRGNQEKASLSLMDGSHSRSRNVSLRELPSEISCHSADNCGIDQEPPKVEDSEMSEFSQNLPSGGLQDDGFPEEEAPRIDSALNKEAVIDQEPGGRSVATGEAWDEHAQAMIDEKPSVRSPALEEPRDVDI